MMISFYDVHTNIYKIKMRTKMKYFEKISNQTINEVSAFLKDHPEKQLQYWDWRKSNQLAIKVLGIRREYERVWRRNRYYS